MAILGLTNRFTTSLLCSVASVSRSGYYKWLNRKDDRKNSEFVSSIRFEQQQHHGTLGYRKMTSILKNNHGLSAGKNKIHTLMKQYGLQAIIRRKKHWHIPSKEHLTAPNILNREFNSHGLGEKYAIDITYLSIPNEMVYLSACVDMYSRQVVEYVLSLRQDISLSTELIRKMSCKYSLENALIHTDQGVHFTNKAYMSLIKENGAIQSMSRKGNCWDNAVMENFFSHFKCERYRVRKYAMKTLEDVSEIVAEYMDYYNNKRPQSNLGGLSPKQFADSLNF